MESNLEITSILITALAGLSIGYIFFTVMRKALPKRLHKEHLQQRDLVIQKAELKRKQILEEAAARQKEKEMMAVEELDNHIEDRKYDLAAQEEEILSQEQFLQREHSRMQKIEASYQSYSKKVDLVRGEAETEIATLNSLRQELQSGLAAKADCTINAQINLLKDEFINERQLESQRRIKDITEQVTINSKKTAERTLARLLSRYEPNFVWPKPVSHVDLPDKRVIDLLSSDESTLIADIAEMTDLVEISLNQEKPEIPPVIKLGGGYGMDKEAARLTLEEILPKGKNYWDRSAKKVYQKHRTQLDQQAERLGRHAVAVLKLDNIHPEVQRMVGALNWRTSYRQNQFHHSLEVARLAGILAFELGVDPDIAKRCGLLHDIGKGLDYRIEGSHAVISGDYADRYGESKLVCDTVMSHHNDLVLETPMSYVLKSADTLSGARPGARVNLEEGYQVRLSAIEEVVKSFPGIQKMAIMNGGREVHVEVNHKKIREENLKTFTANIARKIEENVAFPGQIKVLVSRRFESVAVA